MDLMLSDNADVTGREVDNAIFYREDARAAITVSDLHDVVGMHLADGFGSRLRRYVVWIGYGAVCEVGLVDREVVYLITVNRP